ncbi:MAG: zinc ABC transporter substrate-binding protein [Gammaproteobacteria bacterium]|nr:zinc ABC transporter substrate-binding protein [Gammaproteobacteria bacterium]
MHKVIKFIFVMAMFAYANMVNAQLNVFTCEPEWASLAKELGGEKIKVFSATTGLQDPHHIQARPSLLARARRADLLVCTGAELEIGWLPILLRKTANAEIQPGKPGNLMVTEYLSLKDKPDRLDRREGDMHAEGNPHVQTSPYNISKIALILLKRLQQIDAGNAAVYQNNYDDFIQRWQRAIARWEEEASVLRGKSLIVYHRNWGYMTDWLGLNVVAVIEPRPGIPPSSAYLSKIIKQMEVSPAKMIIHAAHQPAKASDWLSSKLAIKKVQLPFTVGGSKTAHDLFSLFDETIQLLVSGLQ